MDAAYSLTRPSTCMIPMLAFDKLTYIPPVASQPPGHLATWEHRAGGHTDMQPKITTPIQYLMHVASHEQKQSGLQVPQS